LAAYTLVERDRAVQKAAVAKGSFINRFRIVGLKLGVPEAGVQHYCS
jgi:hypothetical protein